MKLPDGNLTFEVKRNGETSTWSADCVELKLLCEELEGKHGVKERDGVMEPNRAFLSELADRLSEMGLTGCSITAAHAVWHTVNARFTIEHDRLTGQINTLLD